MKRLLALCAGLLIAASTVFAQSIPAAQHFPARSNAVFIANQGQWPEQVLFMTNLGGLDAWITRNGVVYDFYQLVSTKTEGVNDFKSVETTQQTGRKGHVIGMQYLNASTQIAVSGEGQQPGYHNYLLGNNPSAWATNVPLYSEAVVSDIYDDVDVRYYFDAGRLRYDFIVHPGADVSQICMRAEGTSDISVNEKGELVIPTRFGPVTQAKLFTFQNVNGAKQEVSSRFVVNGNTIRFSVGTFDTQNDLIIDPVLWSTFIGGGGTDQMQAVEIDGSGNVCLAGISSAGTFPVTAGVYDASYNGGTYDVVAAKLNPSGTTLIFATFIGGSNTDQANSVKVDAAGNFYLGGFTASNDYPATAGAFDQTANGANDCFVTKLNATGTALVYSTYIGGAGADICYGIALDAGGNVYVGGNTTASGYPVTAGAFDVLYEGTSDIIVTKLNPTGTALVYSTFIGGATGEVAYAICTDASGAAYITGYSSSVNYPTTAGAYSQTYVGGASEGIITKLNAAGSALVYSTHIGGVSDDRLNAIAVDGSGNVYVAGYAYTGVTNYPTTAGAYDQTYNGGTCDIVVTKLNSAGSALTFSTFIGGSGNDFATGVAVDGFGNVTVTGYVASSNYPTTAGAFDQTYNGGAYDVPVSKLDATGATLSYSTFLGGAGDEYGTAIGVDASGGVYVTGSTGSTAYPVTAGVYDQSFNGGVDVFVTKVSACIAPAITIGSNSPVCTGQTINLTSSGASTYTWSGPNSFASNVQNPAIAGATTANSGIYTVTAVNASGCANTATVNVNVGPNATAASNAPLCAGQTLNLSSSGGATYAWSGPNSFTSASQNPSIAGITTAGNGTYSVTVTDGNGCTATASVSVTVNALPNATASSNAPVCAGQTLNLTSGTVAGATYSWSGPSSYSSTLQNPVIAAATTANSGTYSVIVTNANGCTATASVSVTVNALPAATASANGPLCAGQTLNLTSGGGAMYSWSGPNSYSSALQNPSVSNVTAAQGGTYSVIVTSAAGCSATATVNVVVNALPTAAASGNSPLCEGQTLNLTSSGGATYAWSGPSSYVSSAQNPSLANVTAANTGTYVVTVTNASGCTATVSAVITVNALPVAAASSNGPICAGQTLNLASSGGVTYQWSGPNSFSGTLQNVSVTNASVTDGGTYSVIVTNASGCTATATVNAVVNALPSPSAAANGPLCEGQTLNLTSSGGVTYQWSGPNSFISTTQNPSLANVTVADAGTYSVIVTDAAGCSATANSSVAVNTLPAAASTVNGPVCEGQAINLSATGGTSYAWNGPNSFSSAQQNPSLNNVTIADAGVYSVTVTDANGCSASSSATVVINANPVVAAMENGPLCAGSTLNLTASGGATYAWSGPGNFQSAVQNPVITNVSAAEAGSYSVLVTDSNGCSATAILNVIVNVVDTAVSEINGGTLIANASGAVYQWMDCVTAQPVAGATSQAFIPTQNGQYALIVTENGCTDTSSCYNYISTSAGVAQESTVTYVYPNPSDGVINIALSNRGNVQLRVYDVTGKLVQQEMVNGPGVHTLQLDQPAGVYVLEIISGSAIERVRLVIQ